MKEAQARLPKNIWLRGVLWALLTVVGLLAYSGWANADLGPDAGTAADQGAQDLVLSDGAEVEAGAGDATSGDDGAPATDGAPTADGAAPATDGAPASDSGTSDKDDDDDGCSCRVGTRSRTDLGLLLLLGLTLLPIVIRRRR